MELLVRLLATLAVALVLGALASFPVMLLWNSCLVPAIPMIQEVGWIQAWGIMVMGQLMFQTRVTLTEPHNR